MSKPVLCWKSLRGMTALVFSLILGFGQFSSAFAASPVAGKDFGKIDANSAPLLFHSLAVAADAAASGAAVRDRQVTRSRAVGIDTSLLAASADLPADVPAPGRVISLNLFDDVNFVADATRVQRTKRGILWTGRLRGIELSEVMIIVNGDIVAGNISMPSGRYHIRFMGNGIHEVQQIDQAQYPVDEPYVPVPPPRKDTTSTRAKTADVPPQTAADDCSTIDVMVVYSATTRAAAGGTAAMQSLIDLAIAETNQSYQNSGITQRVRLVHSEEVAYAEPGDMNAALDCITSTNDGCLDNVHALRDTYGADLVSFWIEGDGSYCGLGWMMGSVSSGFAPYGFSIVARSCATGYYSFGHELGHNMGARHDIYVDTDTTPYAYSHGYTYTDAASPWRTVMAYNNACSAVGKSCTRIQYWSNPSITYGGVAMGNTSADNQQTLDNTACTVANFRTIPPTVITTVPANGAVEVAITAPITATFSKDMNSSTITTSTFYLNSGGTATVSYNSSTRTATLTPSSSLAKNTTYTATITTGVADSGNVHMTEDKVWSFTTAGDSRTLTVNFPGNGNGRVEIDPGNIVCNTSYSGQFLNGTVLTITGSSFDYSDFNGFTGDCTHNPCSLTMNGNKTVTATIVKDTVHKALIGTSNYFATLPAAYVSPAGNVIKAWGTDFDEVLTCNLGKNVTIDGGYNDAYSTKSGYTRLKGPLTVSAGSLTVEDLAIK